MVPARDDILFGPAAMGSPEEHFGRWALLHSEIAAKSEQTGSGMGVSKPRRAIAAGPAWPGTSLARMFGPGPDIEALRGMDEVHELDEPPTVAAMLVCPHSPALRYRHEVLLPKASVMSAHLPFEWRVASETPC